ncbi:MAG: TIGR02099 family protein [Gammaproteobacteria bacterium]|nr:TIGR02099 family protein [Gammaproteobacteria bacterium]
MRLAELFAAQSVAGVAVSVAAADYHLWARWEDGRLQQLQGDAEASGLRLAVAPQTIPADVGENTATPDSPVSQAAMNAEQTMDLMKLGARFRWQREVRGWRFDADQVHMERQGRHWKPAQVALSYTENEQSVPNISASMSYLQLQDVSQLLTIFSVGGEQVRDTLAAIAPTGEIYDTRIHWQGGDVPRYQAYTRLEDATARSWGSVPAAHSVYGELWVDDTGGQATLDSAAVELDLSWLFRWPLRVDSLSGQFGWELKGEQWRLSGRELVANNADIRARAALDVMQETPEDSPFMSLVVDFEDGNARQTPRYLPTGIMSQEAVEWLDAARIDGRIISGGMMLHGRLQDFPFADGSGVFETRFAIKGGRLIYAQDWPPVQDVEAHVVFRGNSMAVDVQRGRILNNQVTSARVSIPDMAQTPVRLSVMGKVQGATQDKLDYLVKSPVLYEAFAQHIVDLSAEGDSLLSLNLDLPIGNDEPVKVDGWVELTENTLSFPPVGRIASEVEGRLVFTQAGLNANNLQAELLGQASTLNIRTDTTGKNRTMSMRAEGLFNAPDLAAHFLPSFQELLKGDAEWNIRFDIPVGEQDDASRGATLHARSDMVGVAARLPSPFTKKPERRAELDLLLSFPPQQNPVLRTAYDGFFNGIFELGANTPSGIGRGEIRFNGNKQAVLPERSGVRVVGWLDSLPWDDWQNLWRSVDRGENDRKGPPFLHSADVAVRTAEVLGQTLSNLQLNIKPEKNAWQVALKSEQIAGEISVPFDLTSAPIDARLKRAHLAEPRDGGGGMDPRDVPAFNVKVEDFRYKDRNLGSLLAQTTKVANGLRLEQLVAKPQSTTITAFGGWYVAAKQQKSNFQMQVESRNVGKTLKAMGYLGGISGGQGVLNLSVKWPGSFINMDVAELSGRMDLTLKDGQLLDVEPGAGRMFGMLSLQALPRRLLLDFSDVFQKGFSFDRIQGTFTIDEGDAYTNDLFMEGPAARVDIGGRVGLADKDYDQQATVTPHLTDSLPVIGALAAAPQVGAVILFAQKLFQPQIDDATRNRYSITGRWDNPIIKKMKKSTSASEADVEP